MVQFKNVKATVIRYADKKPYHEYKLTENGTRRGQTLKEAYVEIVPGERFAVVVDIGIAFAFGGGDDARIRCSVDGGKSSSFYVSRKNVTDTYNAASLSWRRRTWEHVAQRIDDKWSKYPLVFAELQHDETSEQTPDHAAQGAQTRGKITVEIQCGTLVRVEPRPRNGDRISIGASASTGDVNKDNVPSTMKPRKLGEGVPGDHTWTEHRFTAVKSRFHPPLRLDLIYRTRSALEQLEIIPKSTLAPDPISSPSTTGDHVAITSTSHGAPDLPHDVSADAEHLPPKERRSPDLPPDVSGHVEEPQPNEQRNPDLSLDVVNDTEQPQHNEQRAPDLPLDISDHAEQPHPKEQSALNLTPDTSGDTEQPAPKDQRAANFPLDDGTNAEQSPPKRQCISDSTLDVDSDSAQPPLKKPKKEIDAVDFALKSGIKRERQLSQIKSEEDSKHKDQISTSTTLAPQSNAAPPFKQEATKPSPIIIKDESEDEDLIIVSATPVSRVQSSSTQPQAQVSTAPVQYGDQAKREQKKAILKMRLEQLKIQQELLEMED